ncbi:MAG: glycogen/starch synthase [Candidatus Omnitrophota bacterium]|jgi:glucan phosphorylase
MKKFLTIFICLILSCHKGYCLRPESSRVSGRETIMHGLSSHTLPAPHLRVELGGDAWKDVLKGVGGVIVDMSMEAILPELKQNALEGSRGGLGILEGDSGEGYKKAVSDERVHGIKPFIVMPMYENRLVPRTDGENKRQRLEKVKVDYDALVDCGNPINCGLFSDPDIFDYPQLEVNPSKPIKPVSAGDGSQLKFDVIMYDPASGTYKNFRAAIFALSRAGTPVFMVACKDVDDILYTDSEEGRFSQQVLIGKVVPQLLKSLGIKPAILRVNEAHTIIAMAETVNDPYFSDTAYVFTNHTPITAGLQIYYGKGDWFFRMNLPGGLKDIFVDEDNNLNFSRAAMILAHIVNGVSYRHKNTLMNMFPGFKDKIKGVLNGTGEFWKSDMLKEAERPDERLDSEQLMNIHEKDKERFISLVEQKTGIKLDPSKPVVCAIRRIDYYKQQLPMLKPIINALCQDKGVDTIVNIGGSDIRVEGLGIQVVVGGIIVNEHNNDLQSWIAEFIEWMHDPALKGRFVFVSGNDVDLMKAAACGTDAWIEMPRRNSDTGHQEEACGTSGMRAAINGNIPIMSSGMWGDEFVRPYDALTGEGNGFILKEIKPLELYYALSAISNLYYGHKENGAKAWGDFRVKVYEDAKILYIKNMIKRYVLEVFLPAKRAQRAEKAIRNTAGLSNALTEAGFIVKAELTLEDSVPIKNIRAQVWTDINGKGVWHALDMNCKAVKSEQGKTVYGFSLILPLMHAGEFFYKVRFIINDNGKIIYIPEGFGNDVKITVTTPVPGLRVQPGFPRFVPSSARAVIQDALTRAA